MRDAAAIDNLDQVGQHVWRKCGLRNQIGHSPGDIPNPLHYPIARGRDLRTRGNRVK